MTQTYAAESKAPQHSPCGPIPTDIMFERPHGHAAAARGESEQHCRQSAPTLQHGAACRDGVLAQQLEVVQLRFVSRIHPRAAKVLELARRDPILVGSVLEGLDPAPQSDQPFDVTNASLCQFPPHHDAGRPEYQNPGEEGGGSRE